MMNGHDKPDYGVQNLRLLSLANTTSDYDFRPDSESPTRTKSLARRTLTRDVLVGFGDDNRHCPLVRRR